MRVGVPLLACALALAAAPDGARAHGRSLSYSSWKLTAEGARVRLRLPRLEATRLPPEILASGRPGAPVASYFSDRLELLSGDRPCATTSPVVPLAASPEWSVYQWSVRCPPGASRTIRSSVLLDVAPGHLHFARLTLPDGAVVERVLSEAEPSWLLPQAQAAEPAGDPPGSGLLDYVRLGIEHILSGWDHLAFVLALLLLAGSLGEVAGLVTAFTVAHSLTLGLAVLGWVRPDAGAVEALIGFSIALVAAENAWLLSGRDRILPGLVTGGLLALGALAAAGFGLLAPLALVGLALFVFCHFGLLARSERPARLRAAVAFAFGLVHGFGFAGVLAELALPTGRLAAALFGFNVGVELGQLAFVLLVWPALHGLARLGSGRWHRHLAEAGSAAVCALGLFWFVTRNFG